MGKLEALQELKNAWILRYGNTNQINTIISTEISELMSTKTKLTTEVLNSIENKLKSASRSKSPIIDKLATLYPTKHTSESVSNINKISSHAETKRNLPQKLSVSRSNAEILNLNSSKIRNSTKNITRSSSGYIHVKYPKPTQSLMNSKLKLTSSSISPLKPIFRSQDVNDYRSLQASARINSSSVENLKGKYDWGNIARREYEIYEEQKYAQRLKSIQEKQNYQDYLKKQIAELHNKKAEFRHENQKEKLRLDAQFNQLKFEETLQKEEENKRKNYIKDIMDQNIQNLEKTRRYVENIKSEDREYVSTKVQEDEMIQLAEVKQRNNLKQILASEFNQMIDEKHIRKVKEKEKERQEEIIKQKELQNIIEQQERKAQEEKEKVVSKQIKVDTLTKLADPRKFTKDVNEYLDNKYRKEAQELEELHSRKQETERQRLLKIRQEIQYANTQTLQAKKKIQKYEEEMSQDQLEHLKHQDLDSILQIQQEKQMQRDKLIAYKQELDSQLLTNHRLNEDKLCMSAKELELNRVYLKSIGL